MLEPAPDPGNSPCRDAGTFLTSTRTSGSGTQLAVWDAGYFSDGSDLVPGDRIQLESQAVRVTICQVDYDTNTLTVNTALSWNAGDGVALA